jgi:flagellar hook-associated protein 3 FlgL
MISGTRYNLTLEINRQLSLAQQIAYGQAQISSTKRLQAPSDDPVAAARIAQIGITQSNEAAWKGNLDNASALAARADTTLGAVENALGRANELMISAANGTLSAENRATVALELRSIADELSTLESTKDSRGNDLFPAATATRIPVGNGLTLTAVGTKADIFQVSTGAGPQDMASIIGAAADALDANDPAAIGQSLDDIAAAVSHAATEHGKQGARGNRIDQLTEGLADSGLQLKEERSGLEDTDVTAVVAKLQSQQLTLQAAQAVFARVNQTTLFDLLG